MYENIHIVGYLKNKIINWFPAIYQEINPESTLGRYIYIIYIYIYNRERERRREREKKKKGEEREKDIY